MKKSRTQAVATETAVRNGIYSKASVVVKGNVFSLSAKLRLVDGK